MIVITETELVVFCMSGALIYFGVRRQWQEPVERDIPEWLVTTELMQEETLDDD